MSENIEIIIYQYSKQGRKIEYASLSDGRSYFDPEDYNAQFFWGAMGGISIKVENYKVILDCDEFYVLLKAIDFLLQSMAWINEEEEEWLDKDEEYPNDVAIRFQSGNFLRLSEFDKKSLSLSYLPPDLINTNKRGQRFFSSHRITKELWVDAVTIALNEYFNVIEDIIKLDDEKSPSRVLSDYRDYWKKLKNF